MANQETRVLIDWITFSCPGINDARFAARYFLGLDPDMFTEAPFAPLPGYAAAIRFGDVFVCYDARTNDYFNDMGVCVSMSGEGCRQFEKYTTLHQLDDNGFLLEGEDYSAFPLLFCLLVENQCRVSRLDVAIDERSGLLDVPVIQEAAKAGEVNSRMRSIKGVFDLDGKTDNGSTIYFGSETSDFRVRIYDKAKQLGQADPWVRVELVLRHDLSTAFVDKFVNGWNGEGEQLNVGVMAFSILKDKLNFIDRDDSNISRCTVKSWWVEFLGNVEAQKVFERVVAEHNVEALAEWVVTQVAPSLALTFKCLHGDWFRDKVLVAGEKRWSKKYESLYRNFVKQREADTQLYKMNALRQSAEKV